MTKTATKKTSPKKAQKENLVASLDGLKLLGNVVSWKSAKTTSHKEVVQALKDSGLDEKVAREILPTAAFSRACKRLSDERVIDVLKTEKDVITFQFTQKFIESGEWKFTTETFLTLDKTTGKIGCSVESLRQLAQKELDRCIEERTTGDISTIVRKLFQNANVDLVDISERGGVYFVPIEHDSFVTKVDDFLRRLGGRINRLPVPAGTQTGDATVQNIMTDYLNEIVVDHLKACEGFTVGTRPDTLDGMVKRIECTRVKVEAYAHYLAERSKELLESVDNAKLILVQKISQLDKDRENLPIEERRGHTKPGVIYQMIKCLKAASEENPITRDQIMEHLVKCFPDRDSVKMRATVVSRVPSGLIYDGLVVMKDGKGGFWMPSEE